jgi:hypothetical protein
MHGGTRAVIGRTPGLYAGSMRAATKASVISSPFNWLLAKRSAGEKPTAPAAGALHSLAMPISFINRAYFAS